MRVTGVRSGPRPPGSASLTPQELQIAMLAGSGHRNREIAGELFVSEKTVEAHLGRVFRKLGIRSRTQLALLLPTQEQP
jgi:DNA-binding CsgD family transcriptional regulator